MWDPPGVGLVGLNGEGIGLAEMAWKITRHSSCVALRLGTPFDFYLAREIT